MHICFLNMPIEYYSPICGGAIATCIMEQAKLLIARGHKVSVLTRTEKGETYAVGEVIPIQVKERMFNEIWTGPNRLFRVAQLFHKPLKKLNDYYGVARKAIYVDTMPAGEIPAYDKDIPEFASVKIAMKGAPPQVETDIQRVLAPTFDLSKTERVRYSDVQIVRYPAFDSLESLVRVI